MNILSNINEMAQSEPKHLIEIAENEYNDQFLNLVKIISENRGIKVVLIAGPSGSGKTTSAHILETKLKAAGIYSDVVSLDHFYLPIEKMPKLANGDPDFETVYSLDIEAIKKCLSEIITVGKSTTPVFNFTTHRDSTKINEINVGKNGVLIVEGLHALNPILTENLDLSSLFKIYISVNTSVLDENKEVILTSKQIRLIRRISRDYVYRSSDAERTLKLWTSVVAGEEKNLYCFKNIADLKLTTFHCYEPCIFRDIIIELLKNLPENAENYDYAMKIKEALLKFAPLPQNMVPGNSLIREFIKGGDYENAE